MEKHPIQISAEGLLGIQARLDVNASSLLCFPTKEEAGDTSSREGGSIYCYLSPLFAWRCSASYAHIDEYGLLYFGERDIVVVGTR